MGTAVVGVIAASAARAAEDLLERFRVADATAADRARSLPQLGLTPDSAILVRFARAGVIRQTNADRFYLDEAAVAIYRRRRQSVAMIIAIAAGFAALGVGIAVAFLASASRGAH